MRLGERLEGEDGISKLCVRIVPCPTSNCTYSVFRWEVLRPPSCGAAPSYFYAVPRASFEGTCLIVSLPLSLFPNPPLSYPPLERLSVFLEVPPKWARWSPSLRSFRSCRSSLRFDRFFGTRRTLRVRTSGWEEAWLRAP